MRVAPFSRAVFAFVFCAIVPLAVTKYIVATLSL
jgi:hypothetical protein